MNANVKSIKRLSLNIALVFLCLVCVFSVAACNNSESGAGNSNTGNGNSDNIILTSTMERLESGLSAVRFDGNYYFDEFLDKGGANSDSAVVNFLVEKIGVGFLFAVIHLVAVRLPCQMEMAISLGVILIGIPVMRSLWKVIRQDSMHLSAR